MRKHLQALSEQGCQLRGLASLFLVAITSAGCAVSGGEYGGPWVERAPPSSMLLVGGGGSLQGGSAAEENGESGVLASRLRWLSGSDGGKAHLFFDLEGESWGAADEPTGVVSTYERLAAALGCDLWPDTTSSWIDIRFPARVGVNFGRVEFGSGVLGLDVIDGFIGVEPQVLLARFGRSELEGFACVEYGAGDWREGGEKVASLLALRYSLGARFRAEGFLMEAAYVVRELEVDGGGDLSFEGGVFSLGVEW